MGPKIMGKIATLFTDTLPPQLLKYANSVVLLKWRGLCDLHILLKIFLKIIVQVVDKYSLLCYNIYCNLVLAFCGALKHSLVVVVFSVGGCKLCYRCVQDESCAIFGCP